MQDQCEMCHGLRGHQRIKDAMFNEFDREYKQAVSEHKQLTALYREACWYNFETKCRTWGAPWHASWDASVIEMHRHRLGRNAESGEFPIWYSGAVSDAPPLPPEIISVELEAAKAYMLFMKEQRHAPYDYAPGGRKYEKLLRESPGAAAYGKLLQSSKRKMVACDADNAGGDTCKSRKRGA